MLYFVLLLLHFHASPEVHCIHFSYSKIMYADEDAVMNDQILASVFWEQSTFNRTFDFQFL